jgi:hypothetical protein
MRETPRNAHVVAELSNVTVHTMNQVTVTMSTTPIEQTNTSCANAVTQTSNK